MVIVAVSVAPEYVAVTVATPFDWPVTSPAEETVAMDEFRLCHAADVVTLIVAPPALNALSCTDPPTRTV